MYIYIYICIKTLKYICNKINININIQNTYIVAALTAWIGKFEHYQLLVARQLERAVICAEVDHALLICHLLPFDVCDPLFDLRAA